MCRSDTTIATKRENKKRLRYTCVRLHLRSIFVRSRCYEIELPFVHRGPASVMSPPLIRNHPHLDSNKANHRCLTPSQEDLTLSIEM